MISNHARVAVVGCGRWGRNLVRNFAELGVLAAVVDTNAAAVQDASRSFSVPALTWQSALSDPEISAIAIASPPALHARLAKEALDAQKHVFVEKPLAVDVSQAEAMCEVAERAGRVLMVGHLMQYHPGFIELSRRVAAGELGRLQYIYSNRLNLGQIRREEDTLWSFAPHDISMILALVRQEPITVRAEGSAFLHRTIADVTITHLEFAGGERAHIFVSWLHPFKEQKLVVIGEQAMAVFNDGEPWSSKLLIYPHRIRWREAMPVPERVDALPVALETTEPLRNECQHFIECCVSGKRPKTDGREGLRVLRVLDAATRVIDSNRQSSPLVPSVEAHNGGYAGVKVHESAYVDDGVEIGVGTKIWRFSHVMTGAKIGKDCILGQNVSVGPKVTIGDRCKLQNNVSVYTGVTLEDGVFCGPSCVFTNVMNPRAEIERKNEFQPTLVKRGATIGANATIVCGVTLGEYSFIGAGAVVTRDVPAFALMVGAPARRVGWVSRDGERLGPDLVCPRSGRRYRTIGDANLEEIV